MHCIAVHRTKVACLKVAEHLFAGVQRCAAERLSAEQALNHPWIKHFSSAPNPAADAPFSRTMLDHFRVGEPSGSMLKSCFMSDGAPLACSRWRAHCTVHLAKPVASQVR